LEQLKFDAAQAEREGDFAKVAEIRYGRMKETEDQLAKAKWHSPRCKPPPR
jgi:ATP-dependent Clp protease ATP-binding subunit ClpB